jgi:nitrate reductase delta subunit
MSWLDLSCLYQRLASCLEYPGADFGQRAAQLVAALPVEIREVAPELAEALARFTAWAGTVEPSGAEELYTATFDLEPSCCPLLSVHLFGAEDFRRGAFMVQLRAAYARMAFDSGSELPDHIRIVLAFASRLPASERQEFLALTLEKVIGGMVSALIPANPYHHLFEAIAALYRYDQKQEAIHA